MGGSNPLAHPIQPPLQQTSQSPSHIAVHRAKRVRVVVLEVLIPPAQTPIHVRHDGAQAPPVQPRGLRPHPVFQLPKAFLPGPFQAPLEVIPKEVKPAGLRRVDHPRLFGMQRQARFTHPCAQRQRRLCGDGLPGQTRHQAKRQAGADLPRATRPGAEPRRHAHHRGHGHHPRQIGRQAETGAGKSIKSMAHEIFSILPLMFYFVD
jgi:hypothetical protein